MFVILHGLRMFVVAMFKSRRRLEAENLFLRNQLKLALRRAPPRLRLHSSDRALLVWITRIWPNLLDLCQGGEAGDYPAAASLRVQSFLALEIPT
jgi:hypothetical protein